MLVEPPVTRGRYEIIMLQNCDFLAAVVSVLLLLLMDQSFY